MAKARPRPVEVPVTGGRCEYVNDDVEGKGGRAEV